MAVIDISTLPRIKEQENGNTKMWFQDEDMNFIVSYGKVPSGGFSIRIGTPYDKSEIPARDNLTESDVRRALRNWIQTH